MEIISLFREELQANYGSLRLYIPKLPFVLYVLSRILIDTAGSGFSGVEEFDTGKWEWLHLSHLKIDLMLVGTCITSMGVSGRNGIFFNNQYFLPAPKLSSLAV